MSTEEIIETTEPQSSIDVFALLGAVWAKRKLILIIVGVSTVLSIGISLILPESFLATTVILPEADKSKLSSMGGLSDLASLAGINTGGDGSLLKLYPTIIKSESVLKNILYKKYQTKKFQQPVNLIEYWEIEAKTPELQYEFGLNSLRVMLLVLVDAKTSVITMSISMPEPQLAADILNGVTVELNSFLLNKKTTSAGNQRKFVEERLIEVKQDLTKAENSLKEFREKNRQVLSPQLMLEQERLIRDIQINAAVYTELRKQFEIVKIEVVKNIPVINVMDPARAPAWKDKPKKATIVIIFFFLSFFGAIGYSIIHHQYGRQIADVATKLRSLGEKK